MSFAASASASGVPAGWPSNSGTCSNAASSGGRVCPTAEKALLGITSSKCLPSIASLIRAANGASTALGDLLDEDFALVAKDIHKERAMRRRKLKARCARLKKLQTQRPSYEALLLKLGAAKAQAGRVWSLVTVTLPAPPTTKKARTRRADFTCALNREALRAVRRREGRYLLRTNLTETDPAKVWEFYLQLAEVEAAFKNL